MDKLKEFSKLYLNSIKCDIINKKKQLNILNKILDNVIEKRNNTIDSMLDSYNQLIFKIRIMIDYLKSYCEYNINDKLDNLFLIIIEKICPLIYDLNDELLELYLISYESYLKGDYDKLKEKVEDVKDIKLSYSELDGIFKYLKEEMKEHKKKVKTINGKLKYVSKL